MYTSIPLCIRILCTFRARVTGMFILIIFELVGIVVH
uniref:Uncharacterized protein n=1 Tax=Anguilla anguilla TaxID=7936 RepID=A0A0E9XQ62_ANGAN